MRIAVADNRPSARARRSKKRSSGLALCIFVMLTACTASTAGSRPGREISPAGRSKPAVVLVSGYGVEASTWNTLIEQLSPEATVFAFERPGYGGTSLSSTDADGVRTSDEVVALLSNALDGAKVRRPFVLVAHSLGGQYALRYAKLHPGEIAALVLLDGRMKDYTARCAAVASGCSPPPVGPGIAAHLAAEVRGMSEVEVVMPDLGSWVASP